MVSEAATYLAISDGDLVRRSPIIVSARVVDEPRESRRPERADPRFDLANLETLELLKGALPDRFRVRLPGGSAGWIPGAPAFQEGERVILFLAPAPSGPDYVLTELALSKFDEMEDDAGGLFAVRVAFQSGDEALLTADGNGFAAPDAVRELPSFLDALRTAGRGGPVGNVSRRSPKGLLRPHVGRGVRTLWVNIGGREGRNPLYRWAWEGASPQGVVTVTGTQSNLSDGTNGLPGVDDAVQRWTAVPDTVVRYRRDVGGNVNVSLDETSHGTCWAGPMDCNGGIVACAGPRGEASVPFRGEYYRAITNANVWVRKNVCPAGYDARVFRTATLHELGHTLGLGHPDAGSSAYSTTGYPEWNTAVMRSSLPNALPDAPQADDVAALRYYYGKTSGEPTGCQTANGTLCLQANRFAATVTWKNPYDGGSTGIGTAGPLTSDTGTFWFFGPANVELVLKVLDGRAVNGKYWVFTGALSDVQYTITITDTVTGATRTYDNPARLLSSRSDLQAF